VHFSKKNANLTKTQKTKEKALIVCIALIPGSQIMVLELNNRRNPLSFCPCSGFTWITVLTIPCLSTVGISWH